MVFRNKKHPGAVPPVLVWTVIILAAYGLIRGVTDFVWAAKKIIKFRPAEEVQTDIVLPSAGVGRDSVSLSPAPALGRGCEDFETAETLRVWTSEESPLPEWWDPDNAILVWEDHSGEVNKKVGDDLFTEAGNMVEESDAIRKDGGCPDWNIDSTIWGWSGHFMEVWEMDLFSRIFYLEFWQPNLTLCEAGCDAILQLWDLDGGTMFETLSRVNEDGSYAFSTYPGMWEEDYDPEGFAWCKAYCEERFYEGPVWPAQYFRKSHYHDWGQWSPIPAYEIEGIYFSIGR